MFLAMRTRANDFLTIILCVVCMAFFNWFMTSKLRNSSNSIATIRTAIPTMSTHIIHDRDRAIDKFTERILYSMQKDKFVEKFASCAADQKCHILYWHVQKTGGTYLASRLYYQMNRVAYKSKEWCCHDEFMTNRFRPNPEAYCSREMGVYEVQPIEFAEVIETCRRTASSNSNTFLGLISVREPLERTISAIHQKCNVHTLRLEEPTRSVCERCSYSGNDSDFFDRVTNRTNEFYQGMKSIINNATLDIPILILDNADISDFVYSIEMHATKILKRGNYLADNETFHFPSGKSNAQDKVPKKLCEFGMPATMMKHHATSLEVYRWITQARYGSDSVYANRHQEDGTY